MTPRPVLTASLLTALVVGLAWSMKEQGTSSSDTAVVSSANPVVVSSGASVIAQPRVRDSGIKLVQRQTRVTTLPGLSADGAALLAEQAAVQLLVKESDLALTAAQWAEFAAVTSQFQTVRQSFEATIATVSAQAPCRVEIPAYPVAGDALRERFYGELRERLGAETVEVITARAGAALEGYFGGFGVGVQTLDFAANAGVDCQVTRTAHYWNSTSARDTLTLRRETHFPQLEDPTGERWRPFLALFANRGGEKAGS